MCAGENVHIYNCTKKFPILVLFSQGQNHLTITLNTLIVIESFLVVLLPTRAETSLKT